MSDRREFLKLFGVGCAVVPILNGMPVAAAESKLIEVPKVVLADERSMLSGRFEGPMLAGGPYDLTVIFERPERKNVMTARTFVASFEQDIIDLRKSKHSRLPDVAVPAFKTVRWKMEGEFIPDAAGNLLTLFEG